MMFTPWWNKDELGLSQDEQDRMDAGLGEFLWAHGFAEDEFVQWGAWHPSTPFSVWVEGLDLDHEECDVEGEGHQLWSLDGVVPVSASSDIEPVPEGLPGHLISGSEVW